MLNDEPVLNLLLTICWQGKFPGQHCQFGLFNWLWLNLQDLDFDALMLWYGQMILDHDFSGCSSIIMYGDEVGIGATPQIILQEIASIHSALNWLMLNLDRVINAEENLKLLIGCSHLHFCCTNIFIVQEDTRIAFEQDTV